MWSVRRDKNYCIFRTSCAIATKLKIKNHYIVKKNPEPQNSEMIPFPSAHILDFRNNLPVPPLTHPSCSEIYLMPGSFIAVDLVLVWVLKIMLQPFPFTLSIRNNDGNRLQSGY